MALNLARSPRHLLSRAASALTQALAGSVVASHSPWHLPDTQLLPLQANLPFQPEREDVAYHFKVTFRGASSTCSAQVLVFHTEDPLGRYHDGQVVLYDPEHDNREILFNPVAYRQAIALIRRMAAPKHGPECIITLADA